jgi:hypothetical protein
MLVIPVKSAPLIAISKQKDALVLVDIPLVQQLAQLGDAVTIVPAREVDNPEHFAVCRNHARIPGIHSSTQPERDWWEMGQYSTILPYHTRSPNYG